MAKTESRITEESATVRCDNSEAGLLYYVRLHNRADPPYTNQRHVEAIIDIADDGTLAGIELIDGMPPLRAANSDGGVEPIAWLHKIRERDMEAMQVFSWSPDNPWSHWLSKHLEESSYSVRPLYEHPPAKALDGIAVTDDVYDLRKAAEFLLWQYDRQGPLSESTEAWEQMRAALAVR